MKDILHWVWLIYTYPFKLGHGSTACNDYSGAYHCRDLASYGLSGILLGVFIYGLTLLSLSLIAHSVYRRLHDDTGSTQGGPELDAVHAPDGEPVASASDDDIVRARYASLLLAVVLGLAGLLLNALVFHL